MNESIQNIFTSLFDLLPDSPFQKWLSLGSEVQEYVGWLNWFVPFDLFAKIGTAWLACIVSYYIFVLLKKLIELLVEFVPL